MALFTDTLLLLLKFQNLIWNFTKTYFYYTYTNTVAKYTGLQFTTPLCQKDPPAGQKRHSYFQNFIYLLKHHLHLLALHRVEIQYIQYECLIVFFVISKEIEFLRV